MTTVDLQNLFEVQGFIVIGCHYETPIGSVIAKITHRDEQIDTVLFVVSKADREESLKQTRLLGLPVRPGPFWNHYYRVVAE